MRKIQMIKPALGLAALLLLGIAGVAYAAGSAPTPDNPWRDLSAGAMRPSQVAQINAPNGRWLKLDTALMQAQLAKAAPENAAGASADVMPQPELLLPMPQGGYQRFRVVESPVMEAPLADRYPGIRTYAAQGIDDPTATARLDFTPHGFHAAMLSSSGSVYIDPAYANQIDTYIAYDAGDLLKADTAAWSELPLRTVPRPPSIASASAPAASVGAQLRTYRLALAATGEYTAFHGGTVELGLAAVVTAINRVNGVYERELAVRMVLVANNNLLIYTNRKTDPYTNDDPYELLPENQANLDATIGSANYDVGHVFSTGGGGLADLGVVCYDPWKGEGETGTPSPINDAFYIDYVAHEMGHQFGANHSFNGITYSCGGGNRESTTAYEPGSGSTIMGYAGICGTDDLQAHSDAYFHSISFDEITDYVGSSYGSCGVLTATGNHAPSISSFSTGFNIPKGTPFTLTGTASDADGDALTYQWEQFDLGDPGPPPGMVGAVTPPNFRSFNPSASPARTFPRWSDILNNTVSVGEGLPNVGRTLNFRFIVRDNRIGGGGVSNANAAITVVGTAGPFLVTTPNTQVQIDGGVPTPVTWSVANTGSGTTVNCPNVKIDLSLDGGGAYPTVLAASTPNDGSAEVTFPSLNTDRARLRIACADGRFFDISNTNFSIKQAAGLRLEQIEPPAVVMPGMEYEYVLTVFNTGPSVVPGLIISDTLPAGVSFVSASPDCNHVLGVVTCPVVNLVVNGSASRTIRVQMNVGAVGPQTHTATLTGVFIDPYLLDNTVSFTTHVGAAILRLPIIRK